MDIVDRLRRMYVQDGTDHVQEAADTIERLRAELYRTKMELSEARLEERQAMTYLSKVREIVGGESYPDMILRVRRLRNELDADEELLRQALEFCESVYRHDYSSQALDKLFTALRERLK